MQEKLDNLRERIIAAIAAAASVADLDAVETEQLGRKGELAVLLKSLGGLDPEVRKEMGMRANAVKGEITLALAARRRELQADAFAGLAKAERIDVTLPGQRPPEGHLHLTSQAIRDITEIFARLGFYRVRHPEVEWDWYAFEALNMPGDHPARDEWETFFMDAPSHGEKGRMVLTPHTSSGQVREMERREPPIRMVNISKCYRRQMDVSHTPVFHQFEGLLIDRDVNVTHLRGVLDFFARSYFGPERKTRLRPYHFRFTEPSFEVDISCGLCGGTGRLGDGGKCRLCKEGWLELGGAGMVHPNVLRFGGLDPEEWGGFAFGWGVERTMMMRSGIMLGDIRELYRNDLRFLRQF
jgi:phenylalanyl-tRNA synthetase alpha chain